MKRAGILGILAICMIQVPCICPSKLIPGEWMSSLEFGKKSIQVVYRLYQLRTNRSEAPSNDTAVNTPASLSTCSDAKVFPI